MTINFIKKLLILCGLIAITVKTNTTSTSISSHFIWTVVGIAYGKGIIKLNADSEKLETDITLSKDARSKKFLNGLSFYVLQATPTFILFSFSKAPLGSYLHELGTYPHHFAIWIGGVLAGMYYEIKNNPNLRRNADSSTISA